MPVDNSSVESSVAVVYAAFGASLSHVAIGLAYSLGRIMSNGLYCFVRFYLLQFL